MLNTQKEVSFSCPICFDSKNSNEIITLPCQDRACTDCVTQWITLKISENNYTIYDQTLCIMAGCKKDLCLQELYNKIPILSQQKMDQALLQVYFSKQCDIRKCPNFNCSFAGIIDTKSPCTFSLQCDLCGTKWRDKQHFTTFEKILDYLKNLSNVNAEELSQSWIKQKSKKCPDCHVNIEKNGGCDHMTCRNCGHQFCWICTRKYPKHSELIHIYRQYLFPFLAILLILSLISFVVYWVGLGFVLEFLARKLIYLAYHGTKYVFSGFIYILRNHSTTILNVFITNFVASLTIGSFVVKGIPLKTRMMNLLLVAAFLGVSMRFNYLNTMIGILKVELMLLCAPVLNFALQKALSFMRKGRRINSNRSF